MRIITAYSLLAVAAGFAFTAVSNPARADTNSVMSACSAQYKADKAANKLKAGQTWPQYYSACAAEQKQEDAAVASTPEPTAKAASTPVPTTDKAGKALSPGQIAFYKRERQCGQMWQADKAAGKTAGQTWPKYLSACNAKLKAAGQ